MLLSVLCLVGAVAFIVAAVTTEAGWHHAWKLRNLFFLIAGLLAVLAMHGLGLVSRRVAFGLPDDDLAGEKRRRLVVLQELLADLQRQREAGRIDEPEFARRRDDLLRQL
jgi:hypothetical protein